MPEVGSQTRESFVKDRASSTNSTPAHSRPVTRSQTRASLLCSVKGESETESGRSPHSASRSRPAPRTPARKRVDTPALTKREREPVPLPVPQDYLAGTVSFTQCEPDHEPQPAAQLHAAHQPQEPKMDFNVEAFAQALAHSLQGVMQQLNERQHEQVTLQQQFFAEQRAALQDFVAC